MSLRNAACGANTSAIPRLDTVRLWFSRSRQRRALAELARDDYLLQDIGVSREDAVREAAKPFWW
jgi:uncharacterized protein YjiS (DUF1127 family)